MLSPWTFCATFRCQSTFHFFWLRHWSNEPNRHIHVHRVRKKTSTFYFLNKPNSQKLTDFNDFWHVKSCENFTDLYTSPVTCSHFTLGNPKKVIFNSIIHTYIWLFYYLRRKQTVIHLPTSPENVATLTCDLWIAKLFHLTEGLLHSFKRWRLWREQVRPRPLTVAVALKRTGCDVWQLECHYVRQAMSQQVFRVTSYCVNTRFQSFSTLFS